MPRVTPLVPKQSINLNGWSRVDLELNMRWVLFNWLMDVASVDALNLGLGKGSMLP